ncbi:tRNA (adenosine(37)-N6)-threonylcarbamoyltransferase complex dimerization subunit type 1 TsaB [Conexibacter sp. SYSU D00693]|uniref:tRNA (adenosine(37)-N6)-threonylcarbamoyltransferase complex dimerization subunit type 1 TsaB n=1 Tax=Conexibacter sp. SYSU D00693 TaxID=2812560 RepID=UPI00196A73A4|nr:tRNA (adenosine(37)-N6)-threonylcarbamoyltransferase complex dimerization subunit type 1 TsaB [Conexibacter sp. SYSU D00693]
MSVLLALDTATPSTVVGVARDGELVAERRHDPGPGERPGHVRELLPLAAAALDEAGLAFADLDRIGAGVGPGTFTGLRIGVATARALAQAGGAELAAVSTLEALAVAAGPHDGPVLACLDARRGELFVAAWAGGEPVLEPAAWRPERLAELPSVAAGAWLACGDGAVRSRDRLEAVGALVPDDEDPRHAVGAAALCRLAATAPAVTRDALVPEYVRPPDATPRA